MAKLPKAAPEPLQKPLCSQNLPADAWPEVRPPAGFGTSAPQALSSVRPSQVRHGGTEKELAGTEPAGTETGMEPGWQNRTDLLTQPAVPPASPFPPKESGPEAFAAHSAQTKVPARSETGARALPEKSARLMGGLYLLGLPAGSIAYTLLCDTAAPYIRFYLDAVLRQYRSGQPAMIVSSQFLAAFLQLTTTMLCGFCAFGIPFLALLALAKGTVFGALCAALFAQYGTRAAGMIGCVFWLPETLHALLFVALSAYAFQGSLSLASHCFGKNRRAAGAEKPRQLLGRYLLLCLAAVGPCVLSAFLALFFGRVLR